MILIGYAPIVKACSYLVTYAEDKPLGKIVGKSHYYDLFRSKKPLDIQLSQQIRDMINQCDKAYDEHGGFTQGELEFKIILQHARQIANGSADKPFSQIFTVEEQAKIIRKLRKSWMDADIVEEIIRDIDLYKPWYICQMLSTCPDMAPEDEALNLAVLKRNVGMDKDIDCALNRTGKKIYYLETLETFLSHVYHELPPEAAIIEWIRHSISQDYFESDIKSQPPFGAEPKVWELFLQTLPKRPQTILFNDGANLKRNALWADVLDREFQTGQTNLFISVGIAHLYGQGNLLELINQKGYKIKYLPLD